MRLFHRPKCRFCLDAENARCGAPGQAGCIHTVSGRQQALVALHIAAIGFYWVWKRQNLIGAMVTGKRPFQGEALRPAALWRLLLGVVLAVGVAWAIAKGLRF